MKQNGISKRSMPNLRSMRERFGRRLRDWSGNCGDESVGRAVEPRTLHLAHKTLAAFYYSSANQRADAKKHAYHILQAARTAPDNAQALSFYRLILPEWPWQRLQQEQTWWQASKERTPLVPQGIKLWLENDPRTRERRVAAFFKFLKFAYNLLRIWFYIEILYFACPKVLDLAHTIKYDKSEGASQLLFCSLMAYFDGRLCAIYLFIYSFIYLFIQLRRSS